MNKIVLLEHELIFRNTMFYTVSNCFEGLLHVT